MFSTIPRDAHQLMNWSWSNFEPYYQDLIDRPLEAENLDDWLSDWSLLSDMIFEINQRLYIAITSDTTDQDAEGHFNAYLDKLYPSSQAADQKLKQKFLASGLQPPNFEIPIRVLRSEAAIFHPDNLPLLSQEMKLSAEYDKIIGAQTVMWEGQEKTLAELQVVYFDHDRAHREKAWRLVADRQLADRQAINDLWVDFIHLREEITRNANLPDYRAYRWQQLLRFDYTPADCMQFHHSIEQVAVPAALRCYERRRVKLGLERLRPWDLNVHPDGCPPLHPFSQVDELESKAVHIFNQVDPQLADYFQVMRQEGLLDLDNRKGKAPGGYCLYLPVSRRPFIFMNAVGIHDDVQTILHEAGHAFHVFEITHLPYFQQRRVGLEFAEVASMAMELFCAPYLEVEKGGFYSPQDAARARLEYLEFVVTFWPYMAVVDAFQHWVYENIAAASQPANCDQKWAELWQRYMPGVDWGGLEQEMMTGWQRKLHIPQVPFYYIEYGLAQLGALQVWRNARRDQPAALAAYRQALSLGGTASLPQLYAAAGAKLAFDADTLKEAVDLVEETIEELDAVL